MRQPLKLQMSSSALNDRNRKAQIDNRATDMVWKLVEYDNMNAGDKLDYLKVTIQKCEAALRQRTDRALQSQRAFDSIIENQRYFAVSQDKYANLAKKKREEIALKSVREVNELINQRKNLQIVAFRLTENFKTKVNSMAQKEVEDIFSKTMKKNQFKASSTLRLAKTFLQKHKVMTTWRAKNDQIADLVEEDENDEDQEYTPKNDRKLSGISSANISAFTGGAATTQKAPQKKNTKITEEENSSVDRSMDGATDELSSKK